MGLRRVVVTGMGMVTPLGFGVSHNWSEITAGRSGICGIKRFDVSDLASQIAGLVPYINDEEGRSEALSSGAFDPDKFITPKERRKIDTFITYAIAAAQEAVEDSGWQPKNEEDAERTGVLIGSGIGGLESVYNTANTLDNKGARRVSPFAVPAMLINLASGHVSIKHGFKGPNHSVVTACATGTHAIGDAARMIMLGDAEVMVAGGAEAAVNRMGIASFAAARALCTSYNESPETASRPWDKDRAGFVIAEGAGVVILEEYEHAKARGAKIYGEVIGYGMSGDAYHITSPAEDGNGGYRAMKAALRSANVNTSDIDYINAHGTSTPVGDGIECNAVKRLFANDLGSLSMSSTKSSIGHLLGAAGAVEAIYTLKSMQTSILPPTLNLDNISDDCQGIDLVPHTSKEKNVDIAVSNSFGFGGTNASLVIKKV